MAKVSELMSICDELEQQMKEGSVCSQSLLEAVLHQTLTDKERAKLNRTDRKLDEKVSLHPLHKRVPKE